MSSLDSIIALGIPIRRYGAKQTGDHWTAVVRAGYPDGACPVWQATGATREEAIERAASYAVDYWDKGPEVGRACITVQSTTHKSAKA